MWIAKGVLLGILFFILGWITYLGILIAIAFYRAGVQGEGAERAYLWSQLIHNPVLWITLLTALGTGLWIMRARTTRERTT